MTCEQTLISCDGCVLYVTESVENVLRRLRLPDATRRLWIDSICIDQNDEDDKTAQVAHMDWVYAHAHHTILWFGNEDAATEAAFDVLQLLNDINTRYTDHHGSDSIPSIADLFNFGMPAVEDSRWTALAAFLHNEWFSRTWVLQEVALAKSASIWNGQHCFPWYNFGWIVYNLEVSGAGLRLLLPLNRSWLVTRIQVESRRSQGATLLLLLYMSLLTVTTSPKDKAFALLGLAADKEDLRQILDYGDSDSTTFTKVATFYLERGRLDILNLCSDLSLRNIQDLPSWVPDWSSSAPTLNMLANMARIQSFSTEPGMYRYRKLPRFDNDGRTLAVSGAILDQVIQIGEHASPLKPNVHAMNHKRAGLHVERWRKMAQTLNSYPTSDSIDEAFARTLVLGGVCVGDQRESFRDLYSAWTSQLLKQSLSEDINNTIDGTVLRRYMEVAASTCRQRTFFLTDGGYMGIGPYFLRPSDSIAHIDGGATLYVTRKAKDGCHAIVGDAYVHGMMDLTLDDDQLRDILIV